MNGANRFKSQKRRKVAAFLISRYPMNFLRVFLYRKICGFDIHRSARIGLGTMLTVDQAHIGKVDIGAFNRFEGPFALEIANGAVIGTYNTCECGWWALEDRFADAGYLRTCRIGKEAIITSHHFIDAIGGFELKERAWLAGRDSQFWTHGAGVEDRSVVIGGDCYIGSAVRFAPGSGVGDHCLVGMGSVVTKRFEEKNLLIGGFPAQIIRSDYDWKNRNLSATKE